MNQSKNNSNNLKRSREDENQDQEQDQDQDLDQYLDQTITKNIKIHTRNPNPLISLYKEKSGWYDNDISSLNDAEIRKLRYGN